MSKLRRDKANRFEDGNRASIGDYYVDRACEALDHACACEAALFVQSFTARDVVPMLFHDVDVAKLKAVHGLLHDEQNRGTFNLKPYLNGSITIRTADMPAPAISALYWQVDRAGPLAAAVQTLNELHVKWGAVKHLLRWFNRNATPGAVRANWPSVLLLCPDSPALKQLDASPLRYTNPQALSSLLPLIRSTATTVAAMAMIPSDATPRIRNTVWVVLPERSVTYAGVKIDLNALLFFL